MTDRLLNVLGFGARFWSIWRQEHADAPIVFDGADLSGMILTGVDFSGASFRGARLHATNLMNADLRGADFTDADLTGFLEFRARTSNVEPRTRNLTLVRKASRPAIR